MAKRELKMHYPREYIYSGFIQGSEEENREMFDVYKNISREELFAKVKESRVVGAWAHFQSAIERVSLPQGHPFYELTLELFQDKEKFLTWLKEMNEKFGMGFPYIECFNQYTGKRGYQTELVNPEYELKLFDKDLPTLWLRYMYTDLVKTNIRVSSYADTIFVDKWLLAQEFDSFDALVEAFDKKAIEEFHEEQASNEETADDVAAETTSNEEIVEKASESVSDEITESP